MCCVLVDNSDVFCWFVVLWFSITLFGFRGGNDEPRDESLLPMGGRAGWGGETNPVGLLRDSRSLGTFRWLLLLLLLLDTVLPTVLFLHLIPDRVEVGVRHRLLTGEPILMIETEKLVQEIQGFLAAEVLVFLRDELRPILPRVAPENVIELGIQSQLVLVQVLLQTVGPEDFRDLDQLIIVVPSVEEGMHDEDHPREHASGAPHVQTVVVVSHVHQQLRTLEITTRDPNIVLLLRMIELRQSPIDDPEDPPLVIDHHIVRLHIPMHDPVRMTVLQTLQELVHVVTDIVIREGREECLEVLVVHVFEDQTTGLGFRILDRVEEGDDVRPAREVAQDLDLSFDLQGGRNRKKQMMTTKNGRWGGG